MSKQNYNNIASLDADLRARSKSVPKRTKLLPTTNWKSNNSKGLNNNRSPTTKNPPKFMYSYSSKGRDLSGD